MFGCSSDIVLPVPKTVERHDSADIQKTAQFSFEKKKKKKKTSAKENMNR